MNRDPSPRAAPNLDNWVGLTMETDGGRPLLGGSLARKAVEDALTALPRLYPGLRIRGSRVTDSSVELLLDLGRSDEDIYRIVQSFKREVKARLKTQETLWTWEFSEVQGLHPEGQASLLAVWNLLASKGV